MDQSVRQEHKTGKSSIIKDKTTDKISLSGMKKARNFIYVSK